MPISKIKAEHAKKYIGFGKYAKKLGERDDIDDLAIIAHESGDESIIDLFENLPSLADLKAAKTDSQLKKAPATKAPAAPVAPAQATTPTEQAK
jgi:hypothetical protein